MSAIYESLLKFSFTIFNSMLQKSDSSMVVSPYSISSVLGLLANSTSITSESQIKSLLHCNISLDDYNKEFGKLYHSLYEPVATVKMYISKFEVNNFVFSRHNEKIKDEFIDRIRDYNYNTSFTCIQHYNNSIALRIINESVKKGTYNVIENVINELPYSLDLLIVNTVYFQGLWVNKFNDVKVEEFYVGDNVIEVNMMHNQSELYVKDNDLYQAVVLDYNFSQYSFIAVMPKMGHSLIEVNKLLSEKNGLTDLLQTMEEYFVNLKLPQFKLDSNFDMFENLTELGLEELLVNPDYINILITDSLQDALKIKHSSIIDVTKKGTLASEFEDYVVYDRDSLCPRITMNFNRPFLFYIVKEFNLKKDGFCGHLPVFMGTYTGTENK